MKKRTILLLAVLFTISGAITAQESGEGPLFLDSVQQAAGSLAGSLRSVLVGREGSVSVDPLTYRGEPVMLGDLLAMKITSALAGDYNLAGGGNRSVLSPDYADRADLLLTGRFFPAGDLVLIAWQIVRPADGELLRGGEYRLPAEGLPELYLSIERPGTGGGPDGSGGPASGRGGGEPDDDPLRAGSVEPGDIVGDRSIDPVGDQDWFHLSLAQGQLGDTAGLLTVFTEGPTDTYLAIFGPDDPDRLVAENDDGDDSNARLSVPVSAGEYWIRVSGYDDTVTGEYTLRVGLEELGTDDSEPNDERYLATPLPLDGEARRFLLMPEDDVDWYRLEAVPEAGRAALLRAATRGSLDTILTLYDERGNELAEDDDSGGNGNAQVERLIREDGLFYLRVSRYEESAEGPYELVAGLQPVNLDGYEPDDSILRATEIEVGGRAQEHTFVPGDKADWVVFRVDRAGTIVVETAGSLDTYLEIFDRFENSIARNDDGGSDMNARIERELQPGTYFAKVTWAAEAGREEGSYSLRVYR